MPLLTRCYAWSCRTTVDLEEDPAALCDDCGEVRCEFCRIGHEDECEGAIVTGRRWSP